MCVCVSQGIWEGAGAGGSAVEEVTRCLIEGPVSAERGNTLSSPGLRRDRRGNET